LSFRAKRSGVEESLYFFAGCLSYNLAMRSLLYLALLCLSTPSFFAQSPEQTSAPIGDTLTKALGISHLTLPGSRPFHLILKIHNTLNPSPEYNAEIEEYWSSPTQWKRTVTASNLRHITTVNDSGSHFKVTGDYFPRWLRSFVSAIENPVPMDVFGRPDLTLVQTTLPSGQKSSPCAALTMRIGDSPSAPAMLCFFHNGYLASVDTPGYQMEFNEFTEFGGRQIAHLYLSEHRGEDLLVGKIDKLEHSNKKPDFFATPSDSSTTDPLKNFHIGASQIALLARNNSGISWLPVISGKISGSITLFVSVDNHGKVKEASVLSSDNRQLDQTALNQTLNATWNTAVANGSHIQVDGPLILPFSTKTDPQSTAQPEAVHTPSMINAGRAISQPRPQYPEQARLQHISGSVYLRAIIAADGTIDKLGVIDSASPILTDAAIGAVKQWRYTPYLLDGVPAKVITTITVNFNFAP
jgi:TonB family protein